MSSPHPDFNPTPDPAARIAQLASEGLTVPLSEISETVVLHTGFGQGPEFWQLSGSAWPPDPEFNIAAARVRAARLVTDGGRAVTDRGAIVAAGARLYTLIPSFSTPNGGPNDA